MLEKPWMFSYFTKKDASRYRTVLDISQNEHIGARLSWEDFWSSGWGGKKKALLTDQDALLESPCMERYICGFLKIKIPHSVTHQRIYSWQRKDSFISSCEWQNVSYHSVYLLPHYLILSRTLLVLNCLFTNSVNVKEQWLANVVN